MPVSTTHYFVSGDVTIHAGAAIAPGVLLQANPGSRIVIHQSVCVGLGSVIQAHEGTIEIGEGVIIGAGALLVGTVVVGDRACVGAGTTVMNRSIASLSIVPPGSLMVDQDNEPETVEDLDLTEDVWQENGSKPQPEAQTNGAKPQPEAQTNGAKPSVEPQESDEIESPASQNGEVYGQAYVNRMLGRMFPNQRSLGGNG
jgi:carbon dioxide concentrating mechanism protein CcmN